MGLQLGKGNSAVNGCLLGISLHTQAAALGGRETGRAEQTAQPEGRARHRGLGSPATVCGTRKGVPCPIKKDKEMKEKENESSFFPCILCNVNFD